MSQITKQDLISTSKEIVGRALIPQVILVSLILLLHFILLAIWFYLNWDEKGSLLLVIGLLGLALPIGAYLFWGINRFVSTGYMAIHNNLIQKWLQPFCKSMATKVFNNSVTENERPDELNIFMEWRKIVLEKLNQLPSLVKGILWRVVGKFGYTETLNDNLKSFANKDVDAIANLLNKEIALVLITSSKNSTPGWTRYLIPLTCLFYVIIWFF